MSSSRFAIAVHTLALMANYDGKPVKSEYVACLVKTNPVVIRRLLCELSKAGLVESQPGGAGGSWLKRSAADISLWEIYNAVEPGDIFSLHNPARESDCAVSANISGALMGIQNKLDSAVEQTLGKIKLSTLVHELTGQFDKDRACQSLNDV